jgi:hypothetical protein
MTWLTDTVLRLAGPLVLVAVFALPALEASTLLGIVVPGELALVLGGLLAHQGRVPLGRPWWPGRPARWWATRSDTPSAEGWGSGRTAERVAGQAGLVLLGTIVVAAAAALLHRRRPGHRDRPTPGRPGGR